MPVPTAPNILITGTPGVGKSTLCKALVASTGLVWREVSQIAVDNKCAEEYDEEYKTSVLDEDKLLDHMETFMAPGGNIVDYHGCDFFPERWFHAVFVLRTENSKLYDRLTARGYEGKKLEDNLQCEIFQTIFEEAHSSYKEEIVFQLTSDTDEDMQNNIKYIEDWIDNWKRTNSKSLKRKHSET